MPQNRPITSTILTLLTSKKLCLFIFAVLTVFLIPSSLTSYYKNLLSGVVSFLLTCLAVNIVFCTLQKWQKLSLDIICIHLGCFIVLCGALVSSKGGYIATVNIHESDSTSTAYRWDSKQEKPLGFSLAVRKIHREYYPIPVKVGVIKNGRQAKLFQVNTGEKFIFEGHLITINALNVESLNLTSTITGPDGEIIKHNTATSNALQTFPIDLVLVAFQDPVLQKIWVDLEITPDLSKNDIITGTSRVNKPLKWNKLHFYHTLTGRDPLGTSFAGIQIVKDPGVPIVYLGFLITLLGSLLILQRKLCSKSKYSA